MAYRKTTGRIQHVEDVRKKIIDSARTLIARDGLGNLTIRKIVLEADTSIGNFYFHFHDKDDVLGILLDNDLSEIGRRIDAAGAAASRMGSTVHGILAAMVYTGIRIGLESDRQKVLLFHPDIRKLVFPRLEELMIERTRLFFDSVSILGNGLSSELAAVLWQGSLLFMLERGGAFGFSASETAEFCATWNLRALGTVDPEINDAMEMARNAWLEGGA